MSVLVVCDCLENPTGARLARLLQGRAGAQSVFTATGEEIVRADVQAEAVFVVLSPHPDRALEMVAHLRLAFTGNVIAVGEASESRVILQALQIGADHYIDEAKLESGVEAVWTRILNRNTRPSPLAPVTAVLSASGGSGASTVATNLAVCLARARGPCALIDFHAGRGDLAALLDLKPQFTLTDLCRNEKRLDRAMFQKSLSDHASGVRLLAASPHLADARLATVHGVAQILAMARKSFPQVVVDLEDCFHDEQVLLLQQASDILLVCRLDFTSLRKTCQILDYFVKLDIPRSQVQLVVNQYGQPGELPIKDAEDALGQRLTLFIPHDPKTVRRANNAGIPIVLSEPHSKVAQSLEQLARGEFERPPTSSSFFSRAWSASSIGFRKRAAST